MALKAQRASGALSASARITEQKPKPQSPKLEPLGSPGPITPFELDLGSSDGLAGYVVAGARRAGRGLTDGDIVNGMIRAEEERRMQADQVHQNGVRPT